MTNYGLTVTMFNPEDVSDHAADEGCGQHHRSSSFANAGLRGQQ